MRAGPIAVLGPGGVGGLLAGALQRSGVPVVLVAREETAAAIARSGLQIRSVRLGDFTVHPRVVTHLREPVAALIVATKATALASALARVECEPPELLPLLNGLDHIAFLRERYLARGRQRVLASTIRVQAERTQPGTILHPIDLLRVEMACSDPAAAPAMTWLRELLSAAGCDAFVLDSEAQVMWSKLVRLNALACATSAYDLSLGAIRDDPQMYGELTAAVREGARVAVAEGADDATERTLSELAVLSGEASTSMRRDIADGQPPELDAIAGAVLRAAARHGLECPAISRFVQLIVARTGLPAPVVEAAA